MSEPILYHPPEKEETEEKLFHIFCSDGSQLPDHHSGRARTKFEADRMVKWLNESSTLTYSIKQV